MPVTAKPIVAAKPATGVRKPIRTMSPTTTASSAVPQTRNALSLIAVRPNNPWPIALKATASRSRMRPIPGHPSGKLENSFCSLCLLGGKNALPMRLVSMIRN
jgi:hypothetical protein